MPVHTLGLDFRVHSEYFITYLLTSQRRRLGLELRQLCVAREAASGDTEVSQKHPFCI